MKKLIIVLFLCFLIIPFKVNAAGCGDIYAINSKYAINTSFRKYDNFFLPFKDEKINTYEPKIVSGAEFKLMSIDEKYTFETNQSYEEDRYLLNANKSVTAEELYNILPDSIKNIYDSINTKSDFRNFINESKYTEKATGCTYWVDEDGTKYSNKSLSLSVNIPIKLKETKSPEGFQKKDFVLIVNAKLYFNYKTDEENINNKQIVIGDIIRKESKEYFYEYDSNLNYYENITSTNSIFDFLNDNSRKMYGYIYNPLLPVKLEINNFIAGKSSYDTTSNTKVSYKIVASNKGGMVSNENIVKISIPKKLKVDIDTISDEGVYDEQENAISWFIETLDGLSNKELYFDIIVPSKVKGEYKLGSSISNNEDIVEASKNILKVSSPLENPNTGDSNHLVILAILIFLSSISYVFVSKKILINS